MFVKADKCTLRRHVACAREDSHRTCGTGEQRHDRTPTLMPQHTPNSALPYLPHVDGLRALAVALVLVFHAWPGVLPGGFIGVDVFFVISGFIITRQISLEMHEGTFTYLGFLAR